MINSNPTKLARQVYEATAELARCLSTDVSIEPVHVIVPLLKSMDRLQEIAEELGRAAISIDEPAAQAAYRAAEQFATARQELTETAVRLRDAKPSPPNPRLGSPRPRPRT
jgi:methylphosphotriester-DNA--protein-cysteine methyltransferase